MKKGLRNACKSIGLTQNTNRVNTIKPKVLLDFYDKEYQFSLQNSLEDVKASDFIERYALTEDMLPEQDQEKLSKTINFF